MKNIKVSTVLEEAEWYAGKAKDYARKVDLHQEDRKNWLMCTRYLAMYSALVQLVYGWDKGVELENALTKECFDLRK